MKLKKLLPLILAVVMALAPMAPVALADTTPGSTGTTPTATPGSTGTTPTTTSAPLASPVDATAPSVSLTAPASGAQLHGTVGVAANASDNVGVTKVVFYNGANAIGTANASPFGVAWDTTKATNANYNLSAKAFDAAGNVGTSASISVRVENIGKIPDYALNDALNKWEPTITSSFTWDSSTGLWVSPFYTYTPTNGYYHTKPAVTPSTAINNLTAGSGDPAKTLQSILGGGSDPSNSNTGPNSTNKSTLTDSNKLLGQLFNNATVTNNLDSSAITGNAGVTGNTAGGSATSGAASTVMNLLNLLNAMWTWTSGGFTSFVQNLYGSHDGDINLMLGAATGGGGVLGGCGGVVGGCGNPAVGACVGGLATNNNTGPSSTNTATQNCSNDVKVNSQTNGSITNDVNLTAKSGDASVSKNTRGGNATSGDATAELNIVNLINSALGAGQTFFGMINIYGSLNGDLLFPQLHLDGVVGSSVGPAPQASGATAGNSGTGPSSTNDASINNANQSTLTNSNTAAFNNNVDAHATSGSANVSKNTVAGAASTGDAQTNSSVFNLFNTSIFGKNAVLVIVNNMGHWMGSIMNLAGFGNGGGGGLATSGATVQNNNTGPGSSNAATVNNNGTSTIDNSVNGTITNNVKAGAQSGNASVTSNTNAGDAKSGNAKVATNIANIFGSHLNFSGIFGILIVNVFGNWTGSVGVDTAAGNGAASAPVTAASISQAKAVWTSYAHSKNALTGGVGSNGGGAIGSSTNNATTVATSIAGITPPQFAAAHILPNQSKTAGTTTRNIGWLMVLAAVLMSGAAGLAGLERKLKRP